MASCLFAAGLRTLSNHELLEIPTRAYPPLRCLSAKMRASAYGPAQTPRLHRVALAEDDFRN